MTQKNEVFTREAERISFISARRTTMQEDCATITQREILVNPTEQSWVFEVCEETRVGSTTPKLVNALVKILKWLTHLGSGKIDDSGLEARHNIRHNFRAKGIGL